MCKHQAQTNLQYYILLHTLMDLFCRDTNIYKHFPVVIEVTKCLMKNLKVNFQLLAYWHMFSLIGSREAC